MASHHLNRIHEIYQIILNEICLIGQYLQKEKCSCIQERKPQKSQFQFQALLAQTIFAMIQIERTQSPLKALAHCRNCFSTSGPETFVLFYLDSRGLYLQHCSHGGLGEKPPFIYKIIFVPKENFIKFYIFFTSGTSKKSLKNTLLSYIKFRLFYVWPPKFFEISPFLS